MYIDEDDIDWDGSAGSQGVDDDGDCLRTDWFTQLDGSGEIMWWERAICQTQMEMVSNVMLFG